MTVGLLDTSVIIDWDDPALAEALPDEFAVSAITLAELASGPHYVVDVAERSRRQANLQRAESLFEALAFDRAAAHSYGLVIAAVLTTGRSHRGRLADLLIAAIAHANGLALYTRNPHDFLGLESLISVVAI